MNLQKPFTETQYYIRNKTIISIKSVSVTSVLQPVLLISFLLGSKTMLLADVEKGKFKCLSYLIGFFGVLIQSWNEQLTSACFDNT